MEETRTPLTVSELNEYVSGVLGADPNLADVRVCGELSGFKRHSSGHLYFSLKDENALVRCVMFRQQALRLSFAPQDGMQVVLYGRAALYAKDGSFQLYAQYLRKQGEGELYKRFLLLKERLEKEGLFLPERKRQIPFLPRRVGVVTSQTGAAVQDVINIIRRRFPRMPIVLKPVRVQGAGAAKEIASAIELLNAEKSADVLIVGRGGGSIEDLWAFNEPETAYAIANSEIPIISAVGHETDFTIADFVADLRAPTPSAAAELAVPEWDALVETLSSQRGRLERAVRARIASQRAFLTHIATSGAFRAPENRVAAERQTLDAYRERMVRAMLERVQTRRNELNQRQAALAAMNPDRVLLRGYSILSDTESGKVITSVMEIKDGSAIDIRMRDGQASAVLTRLKSEKE